MKTNTTFGHVPRKYTVVIKSSVIPTKKDRNKVWVQLNADGMATGRILTFICGKWRIPHGTSSGNALRISRL